MDADSSLYAKDSITRIVELLQTQFGGTYTYFEDMPLTPPTDDDYPCIMVQKMEGTAVIGPTSTDEVTEQILITILKSTLDGAGSENVRTTTQRELQLMVEGQDPTTLDYKTSSVLYVLRHFLTLPLNNQPYLIDSDVRIRYGLERPGNMETNVAYAEITLTAQRRITIANRM